MVSNIVQKRKNRFSLARNYLHKKIKELPDWTFSIILKVNEC